MARTEQMNIALSKDEKKQLAENAAWFGMSAPSFLRHVALGNTIELPARAKGSVR